MTHTSRFGARLAMVGLWGACVLAQAPAPGAHVHYTAAPEQASPAGALAPRLQNLGSHTFPVSTRNAQAQRFINQGLDLAYAFNHAEARRSFREAARLDPDLAMAHWGQALVLGPNINAAMEANEEPAAYEHVQEALKRAGRATARERAYIEALATRYSGRAEDRRPRDAAYAAAMKRLHEQYPDDLDAAMLYVESMMDLRPWGYWQRDGTPHEGTAERLEGSVPRKRSGAIIAPARRGGIRGRAGPPALAVGGRICWERLRPGEELP